MTEILNRVREVLVNRRLVALIATLVLTVIVTMGVQVPVDEICSTYGEDSDALILDIVGEILNPSVEATQEVILTPTVTPTPDQ